MKKLFCIVLILLNFNFLVFPQRDSLIKIQRDILTFKDIEEVVIDEIEIMSASRTAKKIEDLPISVYIVTREEIQQNGYITLADVLKSVPGFKVSQPGNGLDGETFLMRGFQGNYYTKIMINNVPITPSITGILAIGSQLPIRQAERIEIIFGPASAVYGADATSGVINIITKAPDSFNYAQADIVAGTNEYTYMNFSIGGKTGKNRNILEYSFYGSRQDYNDMNIYHTENDVYFPMHYYNMMQDYEKPEFFSFLDLQFANEITEEQLNNLGIPLDSAAATLYLENYSGDFYKPDFTKIQQKSELIGINLKYKNLTFGYNYMFQQEHSSVGLSPYIYRYDSPTNYIANFSHIFSLQHSISAGKFIFSTNLYYLKYRIDNSSSYGINYLHGYNINDVFIYQASDDVNFEQLITFSPNEKFEFVSGLSYQYSGNLPTTNILFEPFDKQLYKPFSKTVDYNDKILDDFGINPIVFSNLGFFLQSYFKLRKTTIIIGSRYDKNSQYDNIIRTRWAAMRNFGRRFNLRISMGQSYKAPSSEKSYYSIAFPNLEDDKIIYAFIPNNELSPERFKSNEFGIKYKLGTNSYLDVCFYNSEIENIIQSIQFSPENIELPNMSEDNIHTTIRSYKNFENLSTTLNGTQFSLVFEKLFPSINLKAEFYYNNTFGIQQVFDPEEFEEMLLTIDDFSFEDLDDIDFDIEVQDTIPVSMLPKNIGQINIKFEPSKNSYINIENIISSSWIKGYVPDVELFDNNYFKTKGYYNLDLTFGYKFGKHFTSYIKILNVTNAEYGGIDATRTDVDLPYNPQYKRNFRFGINYRFE